MRPERLLRRADAWLLAPGDARRLAALRIGLCTVLAVRLATRDYGAAARRPAVFQPHFYMHLLTGPPSPAGVTALQACGVAAALAAAAGLLLRASLPLALVCALVLNGLANSTGRIVVGDALLLLCLLPVAAAGSAAGEAWSLGSRGRGRPEGPRYGWPVRTAMLAVALAYFFAGVQKWRYTGLSWATGGELRWILYASSDAQAHPNDLALFVAARPLLAHLLAAGALALETCFPLALFLRRARWLFVAGAVAMHLGIRLAMGLDYSAQALTVLVVFVDWPAVLARLPRGRAAAAAPG